LPNLQPQERKVTRRSHTFDKFFVGLLLCVIAWPVWQIVHEHGLIPFLLLPLGLMVMSFLVVFVLGQRLEALVAIFLWLGAVALLAGSILDLETGFPGKNAKFNLAYSTEPVLFVLATLVNVVAVVAGVVYAIAWWRRREA
jgi:hypothetical protein